MRAVRFDEFGDREVLYIADVEPPRPAPERVVVRVVTAGINPGEAKIRPGALEGMFKSTRPARHGPQVAGGKDDFKPGDEVIGWAEDRACHADYVSVPAKQILLKPNDLDWRIAGSLYMPAATATPAGEAVAAQAGETGVVSAAAGGVGSTAVQLLGAREAKVIGIASASNHGWLRSRGVIPVAYGDRLLADIRAASPAGVHAFIDLYGPEYVDLALALGVAPSRIETIVSYERAGQVGAQTKGSSAGSRTGVLANVADLILTGRLDFPIAATFELDQVREAYELLEQGHSHGRIVLVMDPERARA